MEHLKQMEHEMEHDGTREKKGGNTSPPSISSPVKPKKRVNPSKKWVFTWNNYDDGTLELLKSMLDTDADKYVLGKEVGESGTPHIQGWVVFKVRKRPIEWCKIPAIHWERQKGSDQEASLYCMKEGNFESMGVEEPRELEIVRDPMEGLEYKDWQREVMDILDEEPDSRTIYWYWEPIGNSGKTTFAKHICVNNRLAVYCTGKANDVKCMISMRRKEKLDTKICIFGFPRTKEEFVSYEALEEVKDGIFFSGKYEPAMVVMNNPHVIVFANFEPEMSKLSHDRWVIRRITE